MDAERRQKSFLNWVTAGVLTVGAVAFVVQADDSSSRARAAGRGSRNVALASDSRPQRSLAAGGHASKGHGGKLCDKGRAPTSN